MATTNAARALGPALGSELVEGAPAHLAVLDFSAPHLRASHDIPASVCTRVTPEDVALTLRDGQPIYRREEKAGGKLL